MYKLPEIYQRPLRGLRLRMLMVWTMAVLVGWTAASSADAASLELDGTLGGIEIPYDDALAPHGGITIEAWIWQASASSACHTIVGRDFINGTWLGVCNGKLRFYTNGLGSAEDAAIPLSHGRWTHVAVAFDTVTRRYFIDGMLAHESESPSVMPANEAALGIGADTGGGGSFVFNGRIAEVRLWDYARNLAEIRDGMFGGISEREPGLIEAFTLDDSAVGWVGERTTVEGAFAGAYSASTPPVDYSCCGSPVQWWGTLETVGPVDGNCDLATYGGASGRRVPLWISDVWSSAGVSWLYSVRSESKIYFCYESPNAAAAGETLTLSIDRLGNSGDTPGPDDLQVRVTKGAGAASFFSWNGFAWEVDSLLAAGVGGSAAQDSFEFDWGVEFALDRSALSDDEHFRLLLQHGCECSSPPCSCGEEWLSTIWPQDGDEQNPESWLDYHPAGTIPFDGRPPRVRIGTGTTVDADADGHRHPGLRAYTLDEEIFAVVDADDDRDIDRIEVYLDRAYLDQCEAFGTDDRRHSCVFDLGGSLTGAARPGYHEVYAMVFDHRGKVATTAVSRFGIFDVASRADVSLTAVPTLVEAGNPVEFIATTPGGGGGPFTLRLWRADTGETLETCTGPMTGGVCATTLTPTVGVVPVVAELVRTDELRAQARATVVVTDDFYDRDEDGLPDDVEAFLCTSAFNMDSDSDGLSDGWEILGVTFPCYVDGYGGSYCDPVVGRRIDLPFLGADPCRKDLFIQADFESSAEPGLNRRNIQRTTQNLFGPRGIAVHFEWNERRDGDPTPRPGDDCGITGRVADCAGVFVASGAFSERYFRPERVWTHKYVYFPDPAPITTVEAECNGGVWSETAGACRQGRSYSGNTFSTNFSPYGTRTFVHELGHALLLGHGGQNQTGYAPSSLEPPLWYGGSWNNVNHRPNYVSLMNYSIYGNPLCRDPITGNVVSPIDFSDRAMPDLDESNLDERSTSPFSVALRSLDCPTGTVPITVFRCDDPDDGRTYRVRTDGLQLLERAVPGGRWSSTRLLDADAPGIDWNCDGVIEASVSANINGFYDNFFGGSPPDELLPGREDWSRFPGGLACIEGQSALDPRYFEEIPGVATWNCETWPGSRSAMTVASKSDLAGACWDSHGTVDASPPILGEPAPGNPEFCDGLDDDGDGLVDEGCPDVDGDDVPDEIDNCPAIANPTQADSDGDTLGDACSTPMVVNLTAEQKSDETSLNWEVLPLGASLRGFDVYVVSGSGSARHVAALGPSDRGWTVPPEVRGGTFRVSAISSTGFVTAAEEIANPVSAASCAPAPRQDCFEAAKALILAKEDKQGKELLKVSLLKIEGDIPTSTFGDLPTEEGQVSLCLYGDNGDLVQEYAIDRGGELCGRRPCWLPKSTKGFSFSDKDGESNGINKVNLFGGSGGKAKVTLLGKNNARKGLFNLPLVTAELEASTSPSVQLSLDTGACIGATGLSGEVKRSGFYVAKKK